MKNRTKYDRYNEITNAEMTNIKLTNNLQAKEQECEKLKRQNKMLSKNSAVQQWCDMYNKKDKECFDALLKLAKKEQECEELKTIINKSAEKFANDYLETFEENQKLKDDLQNIQHNCAREGCRYYEDNTYKVFYNCKAKTELSKCQQALDEIEYQAKELFLGVEDKDRPYCEKILDIINKAKEK